nr:DNA (cytosine-5-)-methyltransferase (TIGR00675) [uncultured Mediterranean phage uvMED]BAR28422.1 DNA (cytosine-5-)-methyltransferase (TIGR00675) [uncultured Mediterranean phage uvMED]
MKLKLLDLFSGIGGFSLGLESTGYFETIGFVEKDEFCQKVLKKNFNNIPIESEVRNVKGDRYKADIITGGFPCQPFSVAGKRRGTEDDRYLWDETIRVIRECKPRWFIGENVEGIINISEGKVLQQIQKDLEAEGFEVQCVVIPASGIGAWHQRKRVWIIGCNVSNTNSRLSIGENKEVQARGNTINSSSKDVSNSNSFGHRRWGSKGCSDREWSFLPREQEGREMGSKAQRCDDTTSNTNSKGSQGHGVSTDMETEQRQVITERSIEEQQTWWEAQSKLCRTPNGISYELDKDRKNRIKSLGNSIVPLIARELGLAIMKAEQDG